MIIIHIYFSQERDIIYNDNDNRQHFYSYYYGSDNILVHTKN